MHTIRIPSPWRATAILLAATLLTAPLARALDVPLLGQRLTLVRTASGKEKLVFVATGANLPMPTAGSQADPLTSSLGGAFIDVVSSGASPVGAFVAPWGAVTPLDPAGWSSTGGGTGLTYKNKAAPLGESIVKTLVLKAGSKIKVVGKKVGLRLAGEGTVGVRITFGKGTPDEVRLCSQFGPAEVVRDDTGKYIAKRAPAAALANCSDAALGTFAGVTAAIPLDVAHCGPGFDGVGSSTAPGTDLHRVTLHGANEVCNDGTPAVFYIRQANVGGGHEHDWFMWLEGGSNCGSAETCADRWCGTRSQPGYGAHKMSSRYTYEVIKGNGIFKQDPSNEFKDFNMVSTYYCSSDNYVGRDSVDVAPAAGYPGYKIQFNGQAILQGILRKLRDGVTSDDGQATLLPLDAQSKFLFTGSSGGGQGAMYNVNRVADWAATVPVASFKVSIDSRISPTVDDPTLPEAEKESTLARGDTVAHFRNDILDEFCVAHHQADARYCTESSHLLLHHVRQTFLVNQDLEDPVIGPGSFSTIEEFADAEQSYLSTQFLHRDVLAEESQVRALPLPVILAPRCENHVGLESQAFYDNAVGIPPAYTAYNDILGDWWNGLPTASIIDGIGGAVTDTANCYN